MSDESLSVHYATMAKTNFSQEIDKIISWAVRKFITVLLKYFE